MDSIVQHSIRQVIPQKLSIWQTPLGSARSAEALELNGTNQFVTFQANLVRFSILICYWILLLLSIKIIHFHLLLRLAYIGLFWWFERMTNIRTFIHQCFYSLSLGPGLFFSFVIFFYTESRNPWMGDQLVARPLPTHRVTQNTEWTHTHKYQCPEWDYNARSQRSSEQRQFIP
jgi:hypothetical protein